MNNSSFIRKKLNINFSHPKLDKTVCRMKEDIEYLLLTFIHPTYFSHAERHVEMCISFFVSWWILFIFSEFTERQHIISNFFEPLSILTILVYGSQKLEIWFEPNFGDDTPKRISQEPEGLRLRQSCSVVQRLSNRDKPDWEFIR